MSNKFFERPVINSPYQQPQLYWELEDGQPTGKIIEKRRPADLITPVPKPKRRKSDDSKAQGQLGLTSDGDDISTKDQQYDPTSIINEIRNEVEHWRKLKRPEDWQVTPET